MIVKKNVENYFYFIERELLFPPLLQKWSGFSWTVSENIALQFQAQKVGTHMIQYLQLGKSS